MTADFLGMLLLIASLAALGLSIVFDVGRLSAEKARESLLQHQHDKRRSAIAEWRQRTERKRAELTTLQARITELTARRHKTLSEIKALEFTRTEMVHELGEENGGACFWSRLIALPGLEAVDQQDIIFARQIWNYRNAAHVWAPSSDLAAGLLSATFPPRSGVRASMPVPLALASESEADA